MSKVSLEVLRIPYNNEGLVMFTFTITYKDLLCNVMLNDHSIIKADQWGKMIECMRNKENYSMNYLCSDGEVRIYYEKGFVTFHVIKDGIGDMGMNIKVPGEVCIEPFQQAYNELK